MSGYENFGINIPISIVDCSNYMDRLNRDACSESTDIKGQIERYKNRLVFSIVSADTIYTVRFNRAFMKARGIKYRCIPLGFNNK